MEGERRKREGAGFVRVLKILESPGILFSHFSRTGKSWKNTAGPGKSWKAVKLNKVITFFPKTNEQNFLVLL